MNKCIFVLCIFGIIGCDTLKIVGSTYGQSPSDKVVVDHLNHYNSDHPIILANNIMVQVSDIPNNIVLEPKNIVNLAIRAKLTISNLMFGQLAI